MIARACRAWLGPGYQIATQLNVVRPGGKAQQPHRDYHLGFMSGEEMLEYPQYTRPREYKGHVVPEVLVSGDHKKIEEWKRQAALRKTAKYRPDLYRRIQSDGSE